MSRNTQYEFVATTSQDEFVTYITAMYESITGQTVKPSSPEKLFIQWVAYVLLLERAHTNAAGNSNLPSRAEADDLEEIGETIFNLPRPAAKASATTVRFDIQEAQAFSILIPAGTRVTDSTQSIYWATDADAYIEIGKTSIEVDCTCQTAGVIGNGYTAGQINTIVDVFDYFYSCQNITTSDGGTDSPTDDEYYELMVESINSWSDAGARGGYEYFAKQVSNQISDVVVKSPDPGYVEIYVLMADGSFASDEIRKAVFEACNDDYVRPLTDHVSVETGTNIKFNVNFKYFIPTDISKSAAQVATDVAAAAQEYVGWQCGKFGRDINPDKLRDLVLECGIKRLEVTEPVFTVVNNGLSEDHSVPEVPKVGTITITSGGYEDE